MSRYELFKKLSFYRKSALVVIALITGVLLLKRNLKEEIEILENVEWGLGVLLIILVVLQRVRGSKL